MSSISNKEKIIEIATEIPMAPFVLKLFAQLKNIELQTIAEIGVYRGNSARLFRKLFPKAFLYLVDPWKITEDYVANGAPITCAQADMDAAHLETMHFFSDDELSRIFRLRSEEAVKHVNQPLDLVYIDGDHSYENVRNDIELWLPKIRSGGIIAGHDYANPICPDVKPAVDDSFSEGVFLGPDSIWMKIVSDSL